MGSRLAATGSAASLTAFGVAIVLPLVMNTTRHWRRAFLLCFDMVYAAACVGAYVAAFQPSASLAAFIAGASRFEIFIAGIVPAVLFGTMASLGVGRSGLGEFEK